MLEYGRAEFLRDIGHDEERDHVREIGALVTCAEDPKWLRQTAVIKRCGAGGLRFSFDNCGWWWCAAGERPRWADLRATLTLLREKDIDPCGLDVPQVGSLYSATASWAAEKPGYDELARRLGRIIDAVAPEGLERDALRIANEVWVPTVTKWASDLEALREHANFAAGSGGQPGRPLNIRTLQAIAYGKELGWDADAIAAALLLSGAEISEWQSLRKRIRTAFARHDTNLTLVE